MEVHLTPKIFFRCKKSSCFGEYFLETSFDSDDMEMNFINGYELEDEGHSSRVSPRSPQTLSDSNDDDVAYTDEPLADAEWIKKYQEKMKANKELEQSLEDRLQGNVELKEW